MNDLDKVYQRLIRKYDELDDLQNGFGERPKGWPLDLVKRLFSRRKQQ